MIIAGKEIQVQLAERLKAQRNKLGGIVLGIVSIGSEINPTQPFIEAKKKMAQILDIEVKEYHLLASLGRAELRQQIGRLSRTVNGLIIQLPLPEALRPHTQYLLNAIPPEHDPDCLSSRSLGLFYTNRPSLRPPAVEVVSLLQEQYQLVFKGKRALVVGYGSLVGQPLAYFLAKEKATVTIANSSTKDLNELSAQAEIIIGAAGVPHNIKSCAPGAILIDFGCAPAEALAKEGCGVFSKMIRGDIDPVLADQASLFTPTPGGTGPILVAKLFENLLKLVKFQVK